MSNKSGSAQRVISLPKGGGAIKGIGETFQPNLFTGTADYSVPLALSGGRNGFGPSLSLQYSSGNGNGIFGMGWGFSLPRITRKTEKGLPRYDDTDVFVMSGAEDLVPCLKEDIDPLTGDTTWTPEAPIDRAPFTVHRYRPRIEGLFARIERWDHNATGDIHWRVISKDNVTSLYGASPASRITDPDNDRRVYEWLLQESFDSYGNHVLYEYARDNPGLYDTESGIALTEQFERNRRATQLYIRRIYYGNLPSPLVDESGSAIVYPDGSEVGYLRDGRRYAFEVVFDYGDWETPTREPHPEPIPEGEQELFGPDPGVSPLHNPVPVREDRFSSFRARFEVRTLRRCRRALMFHHFAELGGPTLVRSTDFAYRMDLDTRLSFLTEVTVTGYRRDATDYKFASMPPVSFEYSEFRPGEQRYRSLHAPGGDLPPSALNDPNYAVVDVFGDGLPDIVESTSSGMRVWRNRGDGLLDRPRFLTQVPAGVALGDAGVHFGDMGGDGRPDLLVHSGPRPGFFETTTAGTWRAFRPYTTSPSFDLANPNVRLFDLTGNGASDALMTQGDCFVWFECLGEKGFGTPQHIARIHDLDRFPDIFFDDRGSRVRLADMCGNGLNDIVLIHNGRIDYWPNLGYGNFGRRVTMENAPRLEADFDPRRLFLADLNGTGGADLVYVDLDRVHFWFNQSGNRWSNRETNTGTPLVSDADSITFADVFGTGTATLLWSYSHAQHPEGNYKALDFCGGLKPYVLVAMSNNMGATTRVSYAPSTRFCAEDEERGTPWVTKLPFPVQVVDKVEVIDHISKTKLVTRYKYHHGYFDGREREFRGFGRVDQFDTETFEDFSGAGLHGDAEAFINRAAVYHSPPVETRTWFHTGVYFDEDSRGIGDKPFDYGELTARYRREYYQGDEDAWQLEEHDVARGDVPHEAYRALRGAILRSEVFAHDGSPKELHPYEVRENRYRVMALQPGLAAGHGVFLTLSLESLHYHYERNPSDPRASHEMTLESDRFGNALRTLSIAYGRRRPDPKLSAADQSEQARMFISMSENHYTNAIDDPVLNASDHRTPLASETKSFELTGYVTDGVGERFRLDQWVANGFQLIEAAAEISYEDAATPGEPQKRCNEHTRLLYRSNDLASLLPLGVLESLALTGEAYRRAFTPGLLVNLYGNRVGANELADGGFVDLDGDGHWWVPTGRVFYSPDSADSPANELAFAHEHFFFEHRSRDPFGNISAIRNDPYDVLAIRTVDPLGNTVVAAHDYRMLQPYRLTDSNGNRSEASFDLLGFVALTAVMGKLSEALGDSVAGISPEPTDQERQAFLVDPLGNAVSLLGQATTRFVYDLQRYVASGQPVYAATLAREVHHSELQPGAELKVQVSFEYSDGFGREIQTKTRVDAGPLEDGASIASPRWVGSGWKVFNNKGNAVHEFEPFFDDTHLFRFDRRIGVTSTVFYDPIERVAARLRPDRAWEKIVFDPWRQETWDVNDTVLISDPSFDPDVGAFFRRLPAGMYLPTWHEERATGAMGQHEQSCAERVAVHASTPGVSHSDSLGRFCITTVHNRFEEAGVVVDEHSVSRVSLDSEGNVRSATDAKGRVVMRCNYDMLGNRLHQVSMEAGERWVLNDIAGQQTYSWHNQDRRTRMVYDALRRPIESHLQEGTAAEMMVGRTVYGETRPSPEAHNLRGKPVQLFDQVGIVTTERYDFKGNVLEIRRRLAVEYNATLNWLSTPELELEEFINETQYDALDRAVSGKTAEGSICRAEFNEGNQLKRVEVSVHGVAPSNEFVSGITYNAKGQRLSVNYGNQTVSSYSYDPATFRLTRLSTTRLTDQVRLQDLTYTIDPAGNITHIADSAQQATYFDNQVVRADQDFVYDALYRLVRADGREHAGSAEQPWPSFDDRFRVGLPQPGNASAMRRYNESYKYDVADNLLQMVHRAASGDWTRSYEYEEPSLLEPAKHSNRLSRTRVGNAIPENYAYDVYGSMTAMPHVSALRWDQGGNLREVDLGGGGIAYNVYDASGQRVRKVIEKNNGALIEERIYLGRFEIFRRRNAAGNLTFERETLHVSDDQGSIAMVETMTIDNQVPIASPRHVTRYQYENQISSVTLELDEEGRVISYEEYYPYGSTSYQAHQASNVSLKRYRNTGKERDEETGLYYYGARHYAPWMAKWISADPAGIEAGLNLYHYVSGNPVTSVDPDGTDDVTIFHRTTEEGAKNMTNKGAQVNRSTSRVWAGKGFYGLDTPNITGSGAHGDVIVAQKISANANIVSLDNRTLAGARFSDALQENRHGQKIRSEIWRQMYDQGDSKARRLGGKPSDAAISRYFRDYMDDQIRKIAPTADVIKWKNVDGTHTYVVKNQDVIPEKPTVAGKIKGGKFVPTPPGGGGRGGGGGGGRGGGRGGRGGGGGGGGFISGLANAAALIGIAGDVRKERYGTAAVKSSVLVAATRFPVVGYLAFGVGVVVKSRDPEVRALSMAVGEGIENATGSRYAGAAAAAGFHVVNTITATVADMIPKEIRDAARTSPGSLIPAGIATPFYSGKLRFSHCFAGMPCSRRK